LKTATDNRASLSLALIILWLALGSLFSSARAQSMAQEEERPRLKDFGSSLKRLRWDQRQNAAVETERRQSGNSDTEDVVRVETTLVLCDVLVLDRQGRAVKGLTQSDFLVSEDGKPQTIGAFSLGDNTSVARSVVLIMDYSGSQLPYIDTSVEAAKTLVDQLAARDRIAVVTDEIKLLVDFTADKAKVKAKLESLKQEARKKEARSGWYTGHSLQYSALMATLRELFSEEDVRPIIIFQTDGDELHILQPLRVDGPSALKSVARSFSLPDVYRAAENSRATIYSVIPGLRLLGLPPAEQRARIARMIEQSILAADTPNPRARKALLERLRDDKWVERHRHALSDQPLSAQTALLELAKKSGGWADFLEEPSQAAAIYSRIFSDINRRYVIGYYPSNKAHDGKRREVKIEVRGHPEYTVWGRKSYYAPFREE
jgi:VWFA-related protein